MIEQLIALEISRKDAIALSRLIERFISQGVPAPESAFDWVLKYKRQLEAIGVWHQGIVTVIS